MDPFRVPRAVNRHVYKSLIYLQSVKTGFLTEPEIIERVKKTMRRNKPTPHIEETIHQSLLNLTDLGILACTEPAGFAVRHSLRPNGEFTSRRVVRAKPRISAVRPRCVQPKRKSGIIRGRVVKPKSQISLVAFPHATVYNVCTECVSDINRFRDAFRNRLNASSSSSNAVTIGSDNRFEATVAPPVDTPAGVVSAINEQEEMETEAPDASDAATPLENVSDNEEMKNDEN